MRVMSSSPPNNRSLDKLLTESETSGILNLSNRRLKEIGSLVFKYDLANVTQINLTKNRLNEIPPDCYEWQCIESLVLSYNSIKSVSEYISEFKLLSFLDLSNNQLTVLPTEICDLQSLIVLKLNGNKLISLPEEIGRLKNCQELDVSTNELTSIPSQVSQMTSVVYLNIRKNRIFSLPDELSALPLVHLDAGCNLISTIPLSFRDITSLKRLILDHNPLTSPQLPVLRKGQVHLFREFEIQAEKIQIKREVLEDPLMSPVKKSNPNSEIRILEMKARAMSITQEKEETAEMFAEKAAELSKDRRKNSIPSTPEKKPKPRKTEQKKPGKPSPKRQNSADNVPSPPPQTTKPFSREGSAKKGEIKKERKRSASSGNFERKSSTEALLIHQKLSGFPGYKPHPANDRIMETTNSNGNPPNNDKTKEKLQEFVKNRQALSPTDRNQVQSKNLASKKGFMPAAIKPRSALNRVRGSSFNDKEVSFTMRRKTEKLYEELEMMENLRQSIEARLKVSLGDDLPAALSDGVVLCHLTNHIRPRSVSSIHVPSPAVPKLTLAKRRRNIDNFLDACIKIGVPQMKVCSAQDILLEKNIAKVSTTVNELLRLCPNTVMSPKKQVEAPMVKVAPAVASKQQSAV